MKTDQKEQHRVCVCRCVLFQKHLKKHLKVTFLLEMVICTNVMCFKDICRFIILVQHYIPPHPSKSAQ